MGLKPLPGAWATFLLTLGASLGCGTPPEPSGPEAPPEAAGPQEPGPEPQEEQPGPAPHEEQEQPGPVAQDDGPPPVPVLVKDTLPGSQSVPELFPSGFVELGAKQLFTMDDGIHGSELWRTDGTPEGTAMVTDLFPGPFGSNPGELIPMGGRLYFVARTLTDPSIPAKYGGSSDRHGLWRTDGTAGGTEQVVPLSQFATLLTEHRGVLYLKVLSENDWSRVDLWRSDGTSEGTWKLTSGMRSIESPAGPGDALFFTATGNSGPELWKTDGTPEGTVRVMRLMNAAPQYLTALGDRLLFWARSDAGSPSILWTSDGTEAGTAPMKDLWMNNNLSSEASPFVVLGNTAFFSAWDAAAGQELWKTDGTPEGTVRITDLFPGYLGSFPRDLRVHDGRIYFSATGTSYAPELWTTDGTGEGTARVAPPSFPDSDTRAFTLRGWGLGLRYFTSTDGTLWATDGTPEGARVLRRFSAERDDMYSAEFTEAVALDGAFYFTRRHAVSPPGSSWRWATTLWRTDGTPEGTRQLNHKTPGIFEQDPLSLTPLNGQLLFLDDQDRKTLWALDVRTEEVRPLADFGDDNRSFVSTGTEAWFVRKQSASIQELWRTDGTPEGTVRVASTPQSAPRGWHPHLLTPVGGALYFAARDDLDLRDALWRTDGTPEGTVKLQSFAGGPLGMDILAIYPVGSRVYFRAKPGTHQLWVTDGTPESTRFVADLPGDGLRNPSMGEWAAVGDTLYLALGSTVGVAPTLWKTDGKTSGVVRALPKTNVAAPALRLTSNGNQLLFWWTDGASGYELWKSDGTEAGTVPVKEIRPGAAGSVVVPGPLVRLSPNGPWVFAASDGVTGVELWRTDGTAAGTKPLADVLPGPMSSSPANLTLAGATLFFSAWTPETGREPWMLPLK